MTLDRGVAVAEGFVPSWGPVVIEGHVLLELLLEPDSPMAQGGPWECV